MSGAVLGLVFAQVLLASSLPHHDPSVANLIEHFTTNKGVYYNEKQQLRKQNGMMGVFATEAIEEGELLCSVPWNATINTGQIVEDMPYLVCDTVHTLAREMRLGNESEFGPYVQYLLDQRHGQLPSAWSQSGKELLTWILDGKAVPPFDAMTPLEVEWHVGCSGSHIPFEENAAMLVVQRAEDDLMVPVYDFYNHRNPPYLNTVNNRAEQKSFDVSAGRKIEVGEEIYISYNMCSNCGNRADWHGTADMFRDYGFVEMMPQRWQFQNEGFMFDLFERENGETELVWMEGGIPGIRATRMRGVISFRQQIRRLRRLKKIEHLKKDSRIPDDEWDVIWKYSDALVNAMEHAIRNICGDSNCNDEMIPGSPDLYDKLDDVTDYLLYKSISEGYTQSCDNVQDMEFEGVGVLAKPKSPYHNMLLFHMPDGDVCLEMDKVIQTCSKNRPHYHELMVDYPARYVETVKRVLFVGGGDSMLLAEILKYPWLELVVGLELDQVVTRNSFKYFHTQPHFDDERVEWWFGDATKSLRMLPRKYFGSFDLVLVDLPETVSSFPVTQGFDMLEALALLLNPYGIMIKNEWNYLDKMSTIFHHTARLVMRDVPLICDQALTMGSYNIDFLHHSPKDHGVDRRLLGAHVNINERFSMFHDYQKNSIGTHETCQAREESSRVGENVTASAENDAAGIMMVVNIENTNIAFDPFESIENLIATSLEGIEIKILSDITFPSDDGTIFSALVLEEGYITARSLPVSDYVALDIYLLAGFDKHGDIRDALLKALMSEDGSWSSYRIVTGGMRGTSTWKEDAKAVGLPITSYHDCLYLSNMGSGQSREDESAGNCQGPDKLPTSVSFIPAINIILQESFKFIRSPNILVICGGQDIDCEAHNVLAESPHDMATIWSCPMIAEELKATADDMVACEKSVWSQLGMVLENAKSSDKASFGAIFVDDSVPLSMLQILHAIFTTSMNETWLSDGIVLLALMLNGAGRRERHNFLDRLRKHIAQDPIFRAEVVLEDSKHRSSWEIGIMARGDENFFPRLLNVTASINTKSGLDFQIRRILGARLTWQDDYSPKEYALNDYDIKTGASQYNEQSPLGRQSILHLQVADGGTQVSRVQVENALTSALAEIKFSIEDELKSVTEIGNGFVMIALSSEGSTVLVFDGRTDVVIDMFAYDQNEARADRFVSTFAKHINMVVVQRDESPRGTGRVINFIHEIEPFIHEIEPATT